MLDSADRHTENHKYANTGSSYPSTAYFNSFIYLKKNEQAYYKTEYNSNQHNLSIWNDCQTMDGTTHSCTWLEIRKSGDLTVKDPEL